MKVYHYNEIRDSKIFYDKNPPKLMLFLIIVIVILMLIVIIAANTTYKTYIVKGQGIVQAEEKSYIMSEYNGQITNSLFQENKEVTQGEVLGEIKSNEIIMQKEQIQGQIDILSNRIELLERFEEYINSGYNNFSLNDQNELEFYNRLMLLYNNMREYDIDEDMLRKQEMPEEEIQSYIKTSNFKKEQIKAQTISDASSEKSQIQQQKDILQLQIRALENNEESYKLVSPINGILHLNGPIRDGMILQPGNVLASVSSSKNLIFDTSISASDRTKIEVGDQVEIAIEGLIENEYGTLSGQVVTIDSDATITQNDGKINFNAIVSCDKNYLTDKKNNPIYMISGMIGEVRVQYNKITYLQYFFNALGITKF